MIIKKISTGSISFDACFRTSRKAKHLSIRISDNRIDVVLPPGCKVDRGEAFLREKISWIEKHLRNRKTAEYYYLGRKLQVIQNFDLFTKNHSVSLEKDRFLIISPSGSSMQIETIYGRWLRDQARRYIPGKVAIIARKHNFSFRKVSIKGQKTRWGSCSSKGNLSFNYRLMRYPENIIEYVIIHELCHLKEMNHSRKFWTLVGELCPDFEVLKKKLTILL